MSLLQMGYRFRFGGVMAGVLLLGACSMASKEDEAYKRSKSLPPLEVPPDLIAPQQDQAMALPPAPAKKAAQAQVEAQAPEAGRARLEREGALRWLVVKGSVAEVLGEVRAFLAQTGIGVTQEDAGLGMIETEWQGAGTLPPPQPGNAASSELDNALRASLRDKYRIRIETGRAAGGVELYLSHLGLQRIVAEGKTEWQPRPADPLLEAEMLQRLQAFFNAPAQAAARPQTAVKSEQPPVASELIEDARGDTSLELKEDFERSWRRIGLALERSGFVINDRNRTTGVYEIRVGQAFKGDEEGSIFMRIFGGSKAFAPDTQYRVVLKEEGVKTSVIVQHASGGPEHGGMSRRILTKLQKNME